MRRSSLSMGLAAAVMMAALSPAVSTAAGGGRTMTRSIYDFDVTTIDGKARSLAEYKGKAVLIVNTASKCGFTPQYRSLEALYEKYRARGFEVLAFPANDFMGQEPGTNQEIQSFCELNYKTTFPLFSKLSVKGKEIAPL